MFHALLQPSLLFSSNLVAHQLPKAECLHDATVVAIPARRGDDVERGSCHTGTRITLSGTDTNLGVVDVFRDWLWRCFAPISDP